MATIVGVRFKNVGKVYYFDPVCHWPKVGDWAVVETARGQELGEIVIGIREVADDTVTGTLKPVIRIATQKDLLHQEENEKKQEEAFTLCQEKILAHKLDMKLVRAEYTFDNSKVLFYFTANGRVDFRNLVKELASIFKTRIELRQIGVRDEAKMLGGLGPCGRPICCDAFLSNFQPVSIKMAKEQNLSLNPIKISGVCGRLMCCLQYEQEGYEKARKKMPKAGKEVMVPEGKGIVWGINVLKETVKVKISEGDSSEIREYPLSDVRKPNGESFEKIGENNEEEKTEEWVSFEEMNLEKMDKRTAPREEIQEKREKDGLGKEKNIKREQNRNNNQQKPKALERTAKLSQRDEKKLQEEKTVETFPKEEKKQKTEEKTDESQGKVVAEKTISPWQKALEEALERAKGETGK